MWTDRRALPVLLFLGACSLGTPDEASPDESAPTARPTGRLIVHRGEPPALCAFDLEEGTLACEATRGRFAGPARPGGDDLVVIETREQGAVHEERLLAWGGPDRQTEPLSPWAPQVRDPVWAPDGRTLAVTTALDAVPALYTVSVDGGAPTVVHDHALGTFEPDISPDGTRLAFASSRDGNAEIYTLPADGSGTPDRVTHHADDDLRPRFSPRGDLAWISDRDGEPHIWLLRRDAPARLTAGHRPPEVDLAWSPVDGRLAVLTGEGPDDAHVVVVASGTGQILATLQDDGLALEHPAWSPDGAWLAFTCRRGDAPSGVCLAPSEGGPIREIVPATDEGAVWLPRWVGG